MGRPGAFEFAPRNRENARMTVDIHAATDIGLRRTQNEDHHAWWASPTPPEAAVLIVADGMGGARAGEVASQLTVDFVLAGCRESGPRADAAEVKRVVEGANAAVHQESLVHPDRRGMGTTCTVVVLKGRDAVFAHVGDSRAYLVRNRRIEQITRDHSLVAQLVEFHHLTPEEARIDPRRNVVTRSLGVGPVVEVDAGSVNGGLRDGDTLLLCTDGLHGLIEDSELLEHAAGPDLDAGCRALIELAKQRGGHDNITLILARLALDP